MKNTPTPGSNSFSRAIVFVLVGWSFLFVFGVKPNLDRVAVAEARVTAAQSILQQMQATVALEVPMEQRRKEIERRLGSMKRPVVARVDELAALRVAAQRGGLTIQMRSLDPKGALSFTTRGSLDSSIRFVDQLSVLPSPALLKSVQFAAVDKGGVTMTIQGTVLGGVQ